MTAVAQTDSTAPPVSAERIRGDLDEARRRTLALLDLTAGEQTAQHSTLMSPMVWDLAHVGNYEELWLLRSLDGRPPMRGGLDEMYDAFAHPRPERPSLPLLGPTEARSYIGEVRREVLALLDRLTDEGGALGSHEQLTARQRRLLEGGFVYGMVIQHEHQHAETLLATRQLMGEQASVPPGSTPVAAAPPARIGAGEILLPGGLFCQGTSGDPWAYDNERPAHQVELAPFWLDATPVTNRAFSRFVEEGGYDEPSWWDPEGWSWAREEHLAHPGFWRGTGPGGWEVLRFGAWRTLDLDEPVQHVSWYEADAFARWAGRRLPTESEWEFAATARPGGGRTRHPWGDGEPSRSRANLAQHHDGPAPVGSHPAGVNPWGVHQLMGDVWEWTSTDFTGYPGFEAFPYREYSEVFFGAEAPTGARVERRSTPRLGYKVLRGGSWATDPVAVRGTFRNWDHPIRRQIFAGFRTARDAATNTGGVSAAGAGGHV